LAPVALAVLALAALAVEVVDLALAFMLRSPRHGGR